MFKIVFLLLLTIENGEKPDIRVCFTFLHLVFQAKSGTKNNNWSGLNDIKF